MHFYQDILGLTLDQRSNKFAMLRAGQFGVHLTTSPWSFDKKGVEKGAGIFPHFEVENMDAMLMRFKAEKVRILREPIQYPWGRECFAEDPDGYRWSFVELKKPDL